MIKWKLFLTSLPVVLIITAVKICITEVIGLKGLMELSEIGYILTAGIFLIGFMLAGTMSDYKESEKLPGEVATQLETLEEALDAASINGKNFNIKALKQNLAILGEAIYNWLYRVISPKQMFESLEQFNEFINQLDKQEVSPSVTIRLRSETNTLRKALTRIHVVNSTNFLATGYAMLEIILVTIVSLLMITTFKSLVAEGIIVFFVSLVYIYMYRLIKDIDAPFEYEKGRTPNAAEIQLFPIEDYLERLKKKI